MTWGAARVHGVRGLWPLREPCLAPFPFIIVRHAGLPKIV